MAAIGVVGFMLVAGASQLDALYMTVVTLSTVGYSEIVPLDQGGRIFTIALIISGISAIGYAGAVTVEYLVSGHLLTRVAQCCKEQALTALRDHFIVCGFGRVGEGIIGNLRAAGPSVVTIDQHPARCERAETLGVLAIGRDGGQLFLPAPDEKIQPHDVLVTNGPPPNVQQFAEQAGA